MPGAQPSSMNAAAPGHPWFKAAVFALLVFNAAAYLLSGTTSEAVDATAWLTLLVLYELESDFGDRSLVRRSGSLIRGARMAAVAAVVAAAIGYVRGEEWLDAVNSCLWIAIVIVLEVEVRDSRALARYRAWFTAAATTLYAGLGTLVLVWLWRGEWFDAYDAALWLIALVIIEMNILRRVPRDARTGPVAPG